MSNADRHPSYIECVAQVLGASPEPMSLDALIAQVERRRPMTKGARSAIYKAIDQLYQAIPIAPARFGWLSYLLAGSTFRHILEPDEVRRGYLLLDELEHASFFPAFFQDHEPDSRVVTLDLFGIDSIQAEAAIERHTWSLQLGKEFVRWLDDQGAEGRDDLLVSVDDAVQGRYSLRLQPRELRNEDEINQRNLELARVAEDIVLALGDSPVPIYTWELAARLIGRGAYRSSLPPDDLHYVLQEYSRLELVEGVGYRVAQDDGQAKKGQGRGRTRGQLRQQSKRVNAAPNPARQSARDDDWGALEEAVAGMDKYLDADDEEICEAYAEYLAVFEQSDVEGDPLGHDSYHLLEAELAGLVDLEMEFGYLLDDQMDRKQDLADRLFIDPESLVDLSWDEGDDLDYDGPPFWQN